MHQQCLLRQNDTINEMIEEFNRCDQRFSELLLDFTDVGSLTSLVLCEKKLTGIDEMFRKCHNEKDHMYELVLKAVEISDDCMTGEHDDKTLEYKIVLNSKIIYQFDCFKDLVESLLKNISEEINENRQIISKEIETAVLQIC